MPHQKILIIQLRQIGDILLTTPCLKAIKEENNEVNLIFLSHSMGKFILDDCPYIDAHWTYNDQPQWSLLQRLKDFQFDIVLDFMHNPRSLLYSLATMAPRRLSIKGRRHLFYTATVPRPEKSDYIVREKFQILKKLGYHPKDERLILPWSEKDTVILKELLRREKFKDATLRVVMSPTHRRENRRWPQQRYAQLADFLTEKWGACILWTWGPGEESFIDETMSHCQLETIKAPRTRFREMAAIIGNCDLFIGNSNGPSHVAVAADIYSLQIHGPTEPQAWCPINNKHHFIHKSSLDDLTVREVLDQLCELRDRVFSHSQRRTEDSIPRLNWDDVRDTRSSETF